MAKKSLNPADAYRKAQRKKELKKNKTERTKARDFALVKKETWDLEDEIQKLEAAADPSEESRLADLKAELEKINRKKAEYVQEHPEHRRLVYRPRRKEGSGPEEEIILPKRNLFQKNGLPRHPERSIYYDPVMNPFGVAPPGLPYMERPPRPGEVYSDDEEEADEDIMMPEGPPPDVIEDNDVDDIPMPEGPPNETLQPPTTMHSPHDDIQPSPIPFGSSGPPLPPGPPPNMSLGLSYQGPLLLPHTLPPPPPGLPGAGHFLLPPPGFNSGIFPPGFPSSSNFPPSGFPLHSPPPPPPGFFPRRAQSASAMQDPLSSIPHHTFQAHREGKAQSLLHNPVQRMVTGSTTLPPSLPTKPMTEELTAELAAATVYAAPELRDFKKEATAFVPTSVKRKKPAVPASSSKVNAAPFLSPSTQDVNEDSEEVSSSSARPDLLSALKDQFGSPPTVASSAPPPAKAVDKKKSDYDKFMEEMGDILGPTKP